MSKRPTPILSRHIGMIDRTAASKQNFLVSLFCLFITDFEMFVAMHDRNMFAKQKKQRNKNIRGKPNVDIRRTNTLIRGSCQRLKITLALVYREETKWIRECKQTTSKHHRLHRFHFIFMITDRHTMDASAAAAAGAHICGDLHRHHVFNISPSHRWHRQQSSQNNMIFLTCECVSVCVTTVMWIVCTSVCIIFVVIFGGPSASRLYFYIYMQAFILIRFAWLFGKSWDRVCE